MTGSAVALLTGPGERRFAPVTRADWQVASHRDTVVDPERLEVLLGREPSTPPVPWGDEAGPSPERAGLAFDGQGRLYRGDPGTGQLQRVPWPCAGSPVDLLGGPVPVAPGGAAGFVGRDGDPRRPVRAWAVAVDHDEHLFVLDGASGTIAVLDLADGHLLRTVALPATPTDLAPAGDGSVLVATASREQPLFRLDALGTPDPVRLAASGAAALRSLGAGAHPRRVAAAPDGSVWLLVGDGARACAVRVLGDPLPLVPVPGASDLEVDGRGRLVVAGPAGAPMQRWTVSGPTPVLDTVLPARRYDGRGLVRTPDGRVGFWTGAWFRTALEERPRYLREGAVTTSALDCHTYRQQWGRVFVEACVPPDTVLQVATTSSDDPPSPDRTAPADLDLAVLQPLHRRETGREVPWSPLAAEDRFQVYEAPVTAPPGRYLWVRLRLLGHGSATPRVRAVRAEFPGHDLLERLPRTYRRDPVAGSFLRRFLAMVDGQLADLESRAARRDLLLEPTGAPVELLDWLGSLVGLSLDSRWPEAARRTLLAEAVPLFRARGTVAGLRRTLEIYLDGPVVILESYRLRSVGSTVGESRPEGTPGRPWPVPGVGVVGAALRVGPGSAGSATGSGWRPPSGSVTDPSSTSRSGSVATSATSDAASEPGAEPGADPGAEAGAEGVAAEPFAARAHRFSVLIAAELDDEQLEVVADLLDLHRPAHTVVDICPTGTGMRVGIGLLVELSSMVGPSSGWTPQRVGSGRLAAGSTVGRGRPGIRVVTAAPDPWTGVEG